MKKYLLSIICLACIIISGCARNHETQNNVNNDRPFWESQLLLRPTCSMPCWENIIPGETNIYDAITMLVSNQFVKIGELQQQSTSNSFYVSWSFIGGGAGSIWTIDNSEVIDTITLMPLTNSMKIGELTETLTKPEYINIIECRPNFDGKVDCLTTLSFLRGGILAELMIEASIKKPHNIEIKELSPVFQIILFQEALDSYNEHLKKITPIDDESILRTKQPWLGFIEYFYIDW